MRGFSYLSLEVKNLLLGADGDSEKLQIKEINGTLSDNTISKRLLLVSLL